MAIVGVFTNALLLVNSVDLSYACTKLTVNDSRDEVDVTAMGAGYHAIVKGLGDASIEAELLQDLSTGKVHQTLQPLLGSATSVPVEVRTVNAARSATNPAFMLAQAILTTYVPLDGSIGDAAKFTATFKNAAGGTGLTYLTA